MERGRRKRLLQKYEIVPCPDQLFHQETFLVLLPYCLYYLGCKFQHSLPSQKDIFTQFEILKNWKAHLVHKLYSSSLKILCWYIHVTIFLV